MPADQDALSQVKEKRKSSCRSEGTQRKPHPKKDCTAKFKSVGKAARVHDRERRVISTREGKQRVKVTREAQEAKCETLTTTDTRIADHPVVLEEPKDHAETSITQWGWRPMTNHSGNESSRQTE